MRSVNSIVIAPARTGSDSNNRIIVNIIAQINSGIRSNSIPLDRILMMVEIKLIALIIDEIPARCKEKMARSVDGPLCIILLARGGYTVHPVPTPFSTSLDSSRRSIDGINSQNLRLLRRGNAMSGAPSISGRSQFPNPPINTGITKKKIIINACAVIITL